jgi:hypothetical protein
MAMVVVATPYFPLMHNLTRRDVALSLRHTTPDSLVSNVCMDNGLLEVALLALVKQGYLYPETTQLVLNPVNLTLEITIQGEVATFSALFRSYGCKLFTQMSCFLALEMVLVELPILAASVAVSIAAIATPTSATAKSTV